MYYCLDEYFCMISQNYLVSYLIPIQIIGYSGLCYFSLILLIVASFASLITIETVSFP